MEMMSFSNSLQLSVQHIGAAAQDLFKSGSQGRILAAFSKAIYLNSPDDQLTWLVTDNLPMHRRGIQIQGSLPEVAADSPYSVWAQHLLLGTDIDLDLEQASPWVSPHPNPDNCLPFEEIPYRLWALTCLLDELPLPTGFGRYLLEIVKKAPGSPLATSSSTSGLALKHARPILNEIVLACLSSDYSRTLLLGEELIGLGEGLTPSGDDFIGGLLFSSLTIQELYARCHAEGHTQPQGFALSDVERFVESSRKRTNLISYTLLKDLAAGHTFDTLHRFINALLSDRHLESTYYYGLKLVQIGHSTGWDLLTGLWMGLLLTLGSGASLSSSPFKFMFSQS